MDIKSKFDDFYGKYSKEKSNVNTHWEQVQVLYTHKNRHYHNLQHLENMFNAWQTHFPKAVQDSDLLSFSIFYHGTSSIMQNERITKLEAPFKLKKNGSSTYAVKLPFFNSFSQCSLQANNNGSLTNPVI